ncbi:MAG: hypothetical protein JKX67_07330 [Colwellia sp.]|nr:hypothetical protein [Colwellia sp.]
MNKTNARKIAETINFSELSVMFASAKANITDWTQISAVNNSMSKGTAWNILYKGLKPEIMLQPCALKNMIWEFGDHLPEHLKIKIQVKTKVSTAITHQEPIFD